jgi:hypothetical protein
VETLTIAPDGSLTVDARLIGEVDELSFLGLDDEQARAEAVSGTVEEFVADIGGYETYTFNPGFTSEFVNEGDQFGFRVSGPATVGAGWLPEGETPSGFMFFDDLAVTDTSLAARLDSGIAADAPPPPDSATIVAEVVTAGPIVESNADRVLGRNAQWDLPLTGTRDIHVRWEPVSEEKSTSARIAIAGLAVVAAGALVTFLVRRRAQR